MARFAVYDNSCHNGIACLKPRPLTKERQMPAQTAPGSTVPPGSATRGSASLTGALILLATVQLMVILDMTIVNVALPSIDRALRFPPGNISWIVNGYALPF